MQTQPGLGTSRLESLARLQPTQRNTKFVPKKLSIDQQNSIFFKGKYFPTNNQIHNKDQLLLWLNGFYSLR